MEAKKKNPHAQFYGLLAKMPGADKDDLVWQYSSMMTTSLNEFLQKKPREYYQMLNDLRNITKDALQLQYDEERKIKKLRSGILHRLQKHGIDTTDWSRVNAFMRQPRIAGKTLGEMNEDELKALTKKLMKILEKDAELSAMNEYLAKCN